MRVADLLATTTELPRHEVERLLQLVLEVDRSGLVGNPVVPEDAQARLRGLVARRGSGEPLQYIEGTVQFGPVSLHADSRALIPRPETERMWELAMDLLASTPSPVIVDLCTGSGNLALALKASISHALVMATDISQPAISLATENAAASGLLVDFRQGDLFAPLDSKLRGTVDLVVSNPPYIAAAEWESLPSEVRDHEPRQALVAGETGTEVLGRIADQAQSWLKPGGHVVCEIGETQGPDCLELFARYEPRIVADLAGRDRFIIGRASQLRKLH